jgi:hypothetical protein
MNWIVIKVVAKHALVIGGVAAAITIVRDTFVLATADHDE